MRHASLAFALLPCLGALAASAEPTLRGRVMSWDGKPAAGMRIDVVDVAPDFAVSPLPGAKFLDDALGSATAGADGTFAIDGARVKAGLHSLALVVPGGAPVLLDGERIAFGPPALPQDLALTLPPLVACEGVVLDDRGAPAAGVRVGVSVEGWLASKMMTIATDARGAFRCEGLPAPGFLRLVARRGETAVATAAARLPPGGSIRLALHLEPTMEWSGTLVVAGEKPAPVPGTRIVALSSLLPDDVQGLLASTPDDSGTVGRRYVMAETATDAAGRFALRAPRGAAVMPWEPTLRALPLRAGTNVVQCIAPLTGRIVARGAPVSGVSASVATGLAARSDAKGMFAAPQAATVSWRAVAPWGERATVTSAPPVSPVLRFAGARRLEGIVMRPRGDGTEDPIAAATVRVAVRGQRPIATATDVAGRFALEIPGEATMVATVAGQLSAAVDDLPADRAGAVTLRLDEDRALAGRVTSAARDLGGARVLATPAESPGPMMSGSANAAGRYLLGPLSRGRWSLTAWADGFLPARTSAASLPAGRAHRSVTEPLSLTRAGRLRVRCLDADGRPVAGVRVTEEHRVTAGTVFKGFDAATTTPATAASGPDGIALLDGLAAGECIIVNARRPGFAGARHDCATSTPEGATIDLVLAPPASLAGSVRDIAGQAIGGARVVAMPDPTTARAGAAQRSPGREAGCDSDAAGAWELRDLAAGRIELVATAPGYARAEPMAIDLAAGKRIDEIALVLEPGVAVVGDVVTAQGTPVEGARIWANVPWGRGSTDRTWRAPEVYTGADGRFAVEDLKSGAEVELQAWRGEQPSEPRIAVAGADPVRLVLPASGRIDGRVVGSDELLAGVRVTCHSSQGYMSATPDADGTFAMEGVRPSPYRCSALAGDDAEGSADGIVVRAGETTTASITLGPRRMLDVVVRDDATGDPLPDAAVRCWDDMRMTDADGRTRIGVPPAGESGEMWVMLAGYESWRRSLATPVPALFECRLSRPIMLRGSVVDDKGQPALGAQVGFNFAAQATAADATFELNTSGRSGQFTIVALRERDGVIEKGTLDVDVPPEGRYGLVIPLARVPTGSVLVTVLDGDTPAKRVNVKIKHEAAGGRSDVMSATGGGWLQGRGTVGVTDELGSFLAEGLIPGELTIFAGRQGETTVRRVGTITLAPGGRAEETVRLLGGWTVKGRVVRGTDPVEGAQVSANESPASDFTRRFGLSSTTSGPGGFFELGPLPERTASVTIEAFAPSHAGAARAVAEATPASADVVLDMTGTSIVGRVSAEGQPVADAEIRSGALESGRDGQRATSAPDGSFELVGCARGTRYNVVATKDGRAPAAVTVLTPDAGSVDAGVLQLGGAELTGTARAAAGTVGDRLTLSLVQADGSRIGPVQVNIEAGGAWRTQAPIAAPMSYRAATPQHAPVVGVTTLGESLVLAFPRGAEIELSVVRADGRPAPGSMATLISWDGRTPDQFLVPGALPRADGRWGAASADERGILRAGPLAPGAYVIEVQRDDTKPTRVSVTLAEGERKSLSVTLEPR